MIFHSLGGLLHLSLRSSIQAPGGHSLFEDIVDNLVAQVPGLVNPITTPPCLRFASIEALWTPSDPTPSHMQNPPKPRICKQSRLEFIEQPLTEE